MSESNMNKQRLELYITMSEKVNGVFAFGIHGVLYRKTETPKCKGYKRVVVCDKGFAPLDAFNAQAIKNNTKQLTEESAIDVDKLIFGTVQYTPETKIIDMILRAVLFTKAEFVAQGIQIENIANILIYSSTGGYDITVNKAEGLNGNAAIFYKSLSEMFPKLENLVVKCRVPMRAFLIDESRYLCNVSRQLAKYGARDLLYVSDPESKAVSEIKENEYITSDKLYFNSHSTANTPGLYYIASTSGISDMFIGMRTPNVAYSVIKLSTPVLVIERVMQRQFAESGETNCIHKLDLGVLKCGKFCEYDRMFGIENILIPTKSKNLLFVDRTPVSAEVNPIGLTMGAVATFNLLEELLISFEKYVLDGTPMDNLSVQNISLIDITSSFFDNEKGKTVMKKEITPGLKHLVYKGDFVVGNSIRSRELMLRMGEDTVDRNKLKKLEKSNVKIWLLTWRPSPRSMVYATITMSDIGLSINTNFHSSLVYF